MHNVVTDLIAAFAGVEYIKRQVDVDEAASAMGGRLPSSSDEDTNDGFFVRQRRHSSEQMQLEEYLAVAAQIECTVCCLICRHADVCLYRTTMIVVYAISFVQYQPAF